jgi:hypothetical protein
MVEVGSELGAMLARLAGLEERVERLEGDRRRRPAGDDRGAASPIREQFWALEGLKERLADRAGAVLFTGVVSLPGGEHYEWQWGTATADLLDGDWSELTAALAALGHPVRLLLLRRVLSGVRSVADLQEHEDLGTSGQLYHHLRQLVGAGWLRATARGQYAVPPERVIPLLVVLSAVRR